LSWSAIPDVLEGTLARHDGSMLSSVDDVIAADRKARRIAAEVVGERSLTL